MREENKDKSASPGSTRSVVEKSSTQLSETNVSTAPALVPAEGDDIDDPDDSQPVSMDMQHFIGRQLRAVYDDVAKQPVPDRFLELMRQLDSKTAAR